MSYFLCKKPNENFEFGKFYFGERNEKGNIEIDYINSFDEGCEIDEDVFEGYQTIFNNADSFYEVYDFAVSVKHICDYNEYKIYQGISCVNCAEIIEDGGTLYIYDTENKEFYCINGLFIIQSNDYDCPNNEIGMCKYLVDNYELLDVENLDVYVVNNNEITTFQY